jgi:hypothetical protein
MIHKPLFELKNQHVTCGSALSFDSFDSLIKTLLNNYKMHANYKINIVDHVGLSNDAESQVLYAII